MKNKSRLKRLVRAYDKALKIFEDLRYRKRERRKWARLFAKEWHDTAEHINCQEDADELAIDNVGYMIW
ncbi:hypothetical protein RO179_000774 [Escherichia coli]|nr:hypothetical protein [Escherichia coli]